MDIGSLLLNLGFISILEKEYKKAENYLLEAIKYDPDYIKAYENLVLLRIQENIINVEKYIKDKFV